MTRRSRSSLDITPEVILHAYGMGIFPMAESADDPDLFWVQPEARGIIPLDGLRISKSLAKTVRNGGFDVRVDTSFGAIIDACAEPRPSRGQTWINGRIRQLYAELFGMGFCHTLEVYREGRLVGGLYGLAIGGAFFGESMFHRETDASKVALVHLVARLRRGGFALLDTQFVTPHLQTLGAVEIPREEYRLLLDAALERTADLELAFSPAPLDGASAVALASGI